MNVHTGNNGSTPVSGSALGPVMDLWVVVGAIEQIPEAIERLELRDHPCAKPKDPACA